MSCRAFDQPGENSAKSESCQPLIVIEGPHEPTSMQHILKETIDFLTLHDPGGVFYLALLLMSMLDVLGVCFPSVIVSCDI